MNFDSQKDLQKKDMHTVAEYGIALAARYSLYLWARRSSHANHSDSACYKVLSTPGREALFYNLNSYLPTYIRCSEKVPIRSKSPE